MRRVCGCISASSAATEIMKTPRRGRLASRPGGPPDHAALAAVAQRRSRHPPSPIGRTDRRRLTAGAARIRSRGSLPSLEREARRAPRAACRRAPSGSRREPVADVAAAARVRLRRPLAAEPLDGPVRVPGATRIRFVPRRVGTSMLAPPIASARVIGTSTSRLPSARRLKTGEGATRVVTKRSPAGPPSGPSSPLPASRIRVPSLDAGRDVDPVALASAGSAPEPWQSGQGSLDRSRRGHRTAGRAG